MPTQQLVGSRIRERRLDRGLKQAVVAETVGISASYLNLIEHNRRRIGGKLLADLARVLDVDTSLLADGIARDTLDQIRGAAATMGGTVEVERTEDLAARYPGWGALIAAQARKIAALEERGRILTNRIAFDPQLAGSLHEVISAVSAIRASASILVGPEELDADWQRRFHENIHNDSVRLAGSSEALIAYLEAPEGTFEQSGSPFEVMEAYLAQSDFHIDAIEQGATPASVLAVANLQDPVRSLLAADLEQYAATAVLLPLSAFEDACRRHKYDPGPIAHEFGVPLTQVMRRMARLPPDAGHPPMGLVICDTAGVLTFVKPVPGFAMPRSGGACPLWPLFGAFSRPHQPIRMDVKMPGSNAARFLCYALAETKGSTAFDAVPALQSTMLVIPDPPETATASQPVGVSCRICPRTDCNSRREPALQGMKSGAEL